MLVCTKTVNFNSVQIFLSILTACRFYCVFLPLPWTSQCNITESVRLFYISQVLCKPERQLFILICTRFLHSPLLKTERAALTFRTWPNFVPVQMQIQSVSRCCLLAWSFTEVKYHSHSSGAVWELRWPSWAVRPNEPSGFRGRKATLNLASALVSACP